MDINAFAHMNRRHAQIVEAVQLIGMIVRDQYTIECRTTRVKQLLPHVRRGIDENGGLTGGRFSPR
jgi:hypothetical protein